MVRAGWAVVAVFLVGCSGSDDSDGGGGSVSIPSALAAYCTGALSRDVEVMDSVGPSAWSGSGATLPAGTTFLVSEAFDKWEGFAFGSDGAPRKLEGDFSTGLLLGEDFTSDCAKDPNAPTSVHVVLQDSKLYETEAMTGTACTLPAGTEMHGFTFFGGNVAQVSSEAVTAICGFDTGYTNDFVYASLLPK
jgi:hypothetical protein